MAYKLPGGVTVYTSQQEAWDAGKLDKVEMGSDGNLYATPRQGWLLKNMPWLVMGTMAAVAALPAAVAAASGGGSSAAAAAAAKTGGTVAAKSFLSPTTLKLLEMGVGVGSNVYANRTAANASRDAANRTDRSAAEALAYLREKDAQDLANYNEERKRLWGREDADRTRAWGNEDVDRTRREEDRQFGYRREGEREARLAPLRGGSGAFATLNDLAGLRPSGGRPSQAPVPAPVRATDWDGTYATGPGQRIDNGPVGISVEDFEIDPVTGQRRPVGVRTPPLSTTMPVNGRPLLTVADLANFSGRRG